MKPFWLIPAFLVGGIAGALVFRAILPHPSERVGIAPPLTSISPSPRPAPQSLLAHSDSPPSPSTTTIEAPVRPSPATHSAPVPAPAAPVVTTAGGASVDLGPELRKSLTDPSRHESPMQLHAALEREAKDDSWSYPLEAEIRNSLTAVSQNDAIVVHTVECRSTLCEIRLSADEGQGELLNGWNRQLGTQPWSGRLLPVSQYMTSSGGRVEQLTILRRPPENRPRS